MIDIQEIHKNFNQIDNRQIIFEGFSLNIPEGQFVTLLGPNGCGKSTLLNLIAGLDIKYTGKIEIGKKKQSTQELVGYMLQSDLLLPWINVEKNILLGAKIQGLSKEDSLSAMNEYLYQLNIFHLKKKYPNSLSGGEKQKVSLIRTLILRRNILLLDEPFSAIDYNTRIELQATIFRYAELNNTTVVLISHDIDEAIAVSDRIILLDHKPSSIILDMEINLSIPDRNPITARQHPQFASYFKTIWENYPRI